MAKLRDKKGVSRMSSKEFARLRVNYARGVPLYLMRERSSLCLGLRKTNPW
jgi:hypothetical protein